MRLVALADPENDESILKVWFWTGVKNWVQGTTSMVMLTLRDAYEAALLMKEIITSLGKYQTDHDYIHLPNLQQNTPKQTMLV